MTHLALVTGGAGDIGASAARLLAADGTRVVLADHPASAPKLHMVAKHIGAERSITFDVTDRGEVDAALDELAATVGQPTMLFNNAGYQGSFARVDQMSTTDVERVMAVNVVGVFNVLSKLSAQMISAGVGGSFVNTASMAGVSGAPNMAAYSASKAAVIALTKSAAKDLAPFDIRVNAISPAFIGPGAMWDRQVALQAATGSQYYASEPERVEEQMIAMIPMRRLGGLDEVARVVDFLLSDAASYLTGINVEIAGGST